MTRASVRSALTLVVVALIAVTSVPHASAQTSRDRFDDDDASVHEPLIAALASRGIAEGCAPRRFCPEQPITRGQLASILARALDLPASTADHFTDDGDNAHHDGINRIAAAGITAGYADGEFRPYDLVSRGQAATFLFRAIPDTADGADDYFDDDRESPHEAAINRLAAAGVLIGCSTLGPPRLPGSAHHRGRKPPRWSRDRSSSIPCSQPT